MVKAATLAVFGSADRRKRDALIATVTEGERSFLAVGNALRQLRDDRLYMETHATFEAFCKDTWNFAKSRAYQLIDAAKVVGAVSTIVDKHDPSSQLVNEAQARVLAELDTPQKQATVWAKAVETAPKDKAGNPRVTAAHVKKTAESVVGKPAAKPKAAQKDECTRGGKHEPDEDGDCSKCCEPKPGKKNKPTPEPESEGGYEPEEAKKPLEKLVKSLGVASRDYGDVKLILGETPDLKAVFAGIDAACIALKKFRDKYKRSIK